MAEKTLTMSMDASLQIGEALLPFAANVARDVAGYRGLSDVRDAPVVAGTIPVGNVPVDGIRCVIVRNQAEAPSTLRVQVGVAIDGSWAAPGAFKMLGEIEAGDFAVLPALQCSVLMWRGWDRDDDAAALCPAQVVILPV